MEYLYNVPYPVSFRNLSSKDKIASDKIAILIVLSEGVKRDYYKIAIDSVECYAKAHGYQFILTDDNGYGCDYLKEKYFRRHCVITKILPKYEAILHIDADIGVVNPNRKLQELLDENIDITFYDRHFSPEIAIGSYLAKNTSYAMEIIKDFSEYERKLPNSFHGTENGALHIFLAEKLFPHNLIELELCRQAWRSSQNVADQFSYTACIRTLFGANTDFGKVRILRKGTGHVRDDWLTSGIWSPYHDFMLHGWKMDQLEKTPSRPLRAEPMKQTVWYNPFIGSFDMDRCGFGNTTWHHDPKLIGSREDVEHCLRKHEMKIAIKKMKYLGRLFDLIRNNAFWRLVQSHFWFLFYY
ncbi:hypothetical protein CRE_17940 [Caenorhabditis remanei]|uniref:Nucleotide-diphospho-sugar transferase domain-containing protein n=1 Tax=Caenorhabditis remanei TaxID=31234 RepID=E3MDN9_CAERE|nr:hypothetical protein CRE_17940 [Caenorhabditis remanei]